MANKRGEKGGARPPAKGRPRKPPKQRLEVVRVETVGPDGEPLPPVPQALRFYQATLNADGTLRKPKGTLRGNVAAQEAFLEAYARTGVLIAAADAAGVSSEHARTYRLDDEEFDAAVLAAHERFKQRLHDEAVRRGVEGWDEPVFGGQFKDMVVGYVRKFDPKLLEMVLKRHDPSFRESKDLNVNHQGGMTVQHNVKVQLDLKNLAPEQLDLVTKLLGEGSYDHGTYEDGEPNNPPTWQSQDDRVTDAEVVP